MDDKQLATQASGQAGERLAREFLEQQGLTFVQQNIKYKFGELDLIMKQGEEWIFVEVKYRSSGRYGGAINALGNKQIQRLKRAAEHFIQLNHIDAICRFDLIAIDDDQINWLQNAF
ncbi:YraN family protein [Shewanella sp. UCD-KL12]|uniref:YraN family protein n=1 Tax=Shewanella sp. UCD-KL12 TaxID=1917163 RepID=UPI000970ADCF|nr:YraN family protein [Shewanella sp. UCD-KL12]